MKKTLTIIESPYAPDPSNTIQSPQAQLQLHIRYARLAMIDSIRQNETPFASHLLYTQCLDDTDVFERNLGLLQAEQFYHYAERVVFYSDLGHSAGMKQGDAIALDLGIPVHNRRLFPHIPLEKKQQIYSEIYNKGLQLPKQWSSSI